MDVDEDSAQLLLNTSAWVFIESLHISSFWLANVITFISFISLNQIFLGDRVYSKELWTWDGFSWVPTTHALNEKEENESWFEQLKDYSRLQAWNYNVNYCFLTTGHIFEWKFWACDFTKCSFCEWKHRVQWEATIRTRRQNSKCAFNV